MLTKVYLWINVLAAFLLMLLGAIITLYPDWTSLHRVGILMTFVVLGLAGVIAGIANERISSSEITPILTGGKAFCYFDIIGQQFPLMTGSIRKLGKYPLYDIEMKLQVLVPADGGGQLGHGYGQRSIGDMPADQKPSFDDIDLLPFDLKDQDSVDFQVKFKAKNGYWLQFLCLRKVGNKWMKATKVFRMDYGTKLYGQAKPKPRKPILKYADENFPHVDMNWGSHSLLYR